MKLHDVIVRAGRGSIFVFALFFSAFLLAASPGMGNTLHQDTKTTVVNISPQDSLESSSPIPGVPAAVVTKGPSRPLHVVLVDKSRQRLYLYLYQAGGRINLIRSFPCSTGKSDGDKIKEGDRRTPEGVYFFTEAFFDNKVTIFGTTAFHLNYPDPFDTADGREGNGIYLHGTNRPLGSRATNGCVVMNNADLDFMRRRIELHDTPVIISRKLNWISQEQLDRDKIRFQKDIRSNWEFWSGTSKNDTPDGAAYDLDRAVLFRQNRRALIRTPVLVKNDLVGWRNIYLDDYLGSGAILASLWLPKVNKAFHPPPNVSSRNVRKQLLSFLQGWVKAWESRNVNVYMSYYSRRFRAYGMNYRQWRTYKRRLARKYKAIDVQISGIKMKISGSRAVITFGQKYYSDRFQDDGTKVIRLKFESNGWKIRREDWTPVATMEAKR